MVCYLSCSLATAFIVASFFVMFSTSNKMLKNQFIDSLNPEQKQFYQEIIKERYCIYASGIILGILIGLVYLYYKKNRSAIDVCVFAAIIFATSYFYYTLSSKKNWILPYLNQEQTQKWLELYKSMGYKYYLGFFVGFLGFLILGYGTLCK